MARGGEKRLKMLMDARSLENSIREISLRAAGEMGFENSGGVCVVGIKTRGESVARRMAEIISATTAKPVPLGILDITLYRDDIGRGRERKPSEALGTEMPFSIDGLDVLVVDDVIFTGRTARAAIEAITDYGRPSSIKLAVVADRGGGRELPIQPDYCALEVGAEGSRKVVLKTRETDGVEGVFVEENGDS